MRWIPCPALLGIWLAAGSLLGAAEPAGFRYPLFNGENLYGWHVTGCQAGVEDGKLVIKEGDGLVRTDHRYGDFVLELDWRALKPDGWDSGIFFRCELPPEGKPWPSRYQANLRQGLEGNVGGLPKAVSKGLIKPGEWNHFKLTVVGDRAELEINGSPAWKTDGIEASRGYIGLQAEVPGGGQFEFRKISITELNHRSLYNGKDLAGWEGAGRDASLCWQVEDGTLVCTGEKGPWLRSEKEYGDFNLRLEYKINPGGNSGVFVRVPEDGRHHGKDSGVEIQILDDRADRYKNLKPYQYCGGVYDFAPPTEKVGREPGEWNSLEIDLKGQHYTITHNGVEIVYADEKQYPGLAERRTAGFLGLQNHSEQVWFRNVRIQETRQ